MKVIKIKIEKKIFKDLLRNIDSVAYCIVSDDPMYDQFPLGSTKESALEALRSWNKLRQYDGYPQIELVD